METLDHLCAIAVPITWAAPIFLFIWLTCRFRGNSVVRLFHVVGDFIGVTLIIHARAWYAKPDLAGSPVAAVAAAAIFTGPALIGLAYTYLLCTRKQLSRRVRAVYSLGAAYSIMFLSLLPATLVFVQLGGDTL